MTSLFTILATANGPIDVSRRSELPEEAAIEVNIIRSCNGDIRDRWLETVLTSLLRSLLLVHMHPRTLMQVTLLVTKEPSLDVKRGVLDIAILPALANAAFAALVDEGLPLKKTMIAALRIVEKDGKMVVDPTEKDIHRCKNAHAIAWSMTGELLFAESAGKFSIEEWEDVAEESKTVALAAMAPAGEHAWLRHKLEENVMKANAWRESD